MARTKDPAARLEESKERLKEIEAERARVRRDLNRAKAELREAERKQDTRRKILAGAYTLDMMDRLEERGGEAAAGAKLWWNDFGAWLERDDDRALFGLAPRTDLSAEKRGLTGRRVNAQRIADPPAPAVAGE